MATGLMWAPCVADLLLTIMLATATHDDPRGGRAMGAEGAREMAGLGGRWMRTSLPRALGTITCTTLPTLVTSLAAVARHRSCGDMSRGLLSAVAVHMTFAKMAMAPTQPSHILRRARVPGRTGAAMPSSARPPGAPAEEGVAPRVVRVFVWME